MEILLINNMPKMKFLYNKMSISIHKYIGMNVQQQIELDTETLYWQV